MRIYQNCLLVPHLSFWGSVLGRTAIWIEMIASGHHTRTLLVGFREYSVSADIWSQPIPGLIILFYFWLIRVLARFAHDCVSSITSIYYMPCGFVCHYRFTVVRQRELSWQRRHFFPFLVTLSQYFRLCSFRFTHNCGSIKLSPRSNAR